MIDFPALAHGDATTAPFWEAARRGVFLIQQCQTCDVHQFYPRPFCVHCGASNVTWTEAAGEATIHAITTVHLDVTPAVSPPYQIALVELVEGPRVLGRIVGPHASIDDQVSLSHEFLSAKNPEIVFTVGGARA